MVMWSPWHGCHKHSGGTSWYIHKADFKSGVNTKNIIKTDNFYVPIEKNKSGAYKIKSGQTVFLCFSTDFLIEDVDCWRIIQERFDLRFIFLTKRALATFVFRKTGIKHRICLIRWKRKSKKASVCKWLINSDDCNPKCVMWYTFEMDEELCQKCRYMEFMPTLSDENNSYIKEFLKNELLSRWWVKYYTLFPEKYPV